MHLVQDYISSLKNGKILGFECNRCHHRWLTIQNYCPKCGSPDIKDAFLSAEGKVLTFTVQRVAPTQHQNRVPYAIAIIELNDGARVQARIEGIDESVDLVGAKVVFERGNEDGLVFKIE